MKTLRCTLGLIRKTLGLSRTIGLLGLGGLLSLSVANVVSAAENLSLFDNQYTAKMYGFAIDANSRLSALPNGNFELVFKAEAMIGSFSESSQLKWNAEEQTVIPLQYSYKRKGMGKNKDDSLTFDWDGKQVVNNAKGVTFPVNGAKKLQDSLSYQLQLRQDLIACKNNLTYPLPDGKRINAYRFEIVGV